jgi:2-polyprenyl-3-methyl-5-hydroxy-6-metoxy-1,4-benzoquinol methylase
MNPSYTSSNLQKHTSANPLQRRLLERFHRRAAALLRRIDGQTVLDAGCGEGFAMREVLVRQHWQVIGLDGSPGALRVAGELNPARSFAAGNLLELPFPSNSFDLVTCMEVLEHLDDPERGLAELRRVSRHWLLLTVPNEPLFRGANFLRGKNVQAWGNDPGHLNHWSARSFRAFIERQVHCLNLQTSFPWTLALCSVE